MSLEEKLVAILLDGSLSVAAIRQALRERWGSAPPPQSLLRALDSVRFRRLEGDRFILAEHMEPIALPRQTSGSITLLNLHELTGDFVIVDVETTGVDFENDRVFQVAAVRFHENRPVSAFNRYLSPTPATLSASLSRRLGISDSPELQVLIETAPPADTVLPEIISYIGGLPWIAHNGLFDRRFLEALGVSTPFHIDTLELAALVFPTAASLSEEEIANLLNVSANTIREEVLLTEALANIDGPSEFGSYHNALTDVLVLSMIFIELQRRMPGFVAEALTNWRQRTPLWQDSTISALMSSLQISAASPIPPSSDPTTVEPIEALHAYLTAGGRQPRLEQDTMLDLLQGALDARESCACEAPTGTGKTLAYVFPALSFAHATHQKVALCTATKNLQDQLSEELERLDEWGALPVRWALLKGSGNYLCRSYLRRRLLEAASIGERLHEEELYAALFWFSFGVQTTSGLLEERPRALTYRFPALEAWHEDIRADSGCNHDSLPGPHSHCFRAIAYARAERSDVVIMNHALWLTNRGGIDGFGAVVADEAHELENVATSCLEVEVGANHFRNQLRRLFDPHLGTGLLVIAASGRDVGSIRGAIAAARRAQQIELPMLGRVFREFFQRLRLAEDPKYGSKLQITPFPERTLGYRWRDVKRAWRELSHQQLEPLIGFLGQIGSDSAVSAGIRRALAGIAVRLSEAVTAMEDGLTPRNRRNVHILALGPETGDDFADAMTWTLTSTPIDVSRYLCEAYSAQPSLFVSATLDTGGQRAGLADMRYTLDRIGLGFVPQNRRHILSPVLPYSTNAALVITRAMIYAPLAHTIRSFVAELTEAYVHLLQLSKGRALLLFTARSRMTAVAELVRDRLTDIPVFIQGDDLPIRLLERFRSDIHSVLAGLRQFWQGVDVPGEALSLVCMEKLPFPLFTDPLVRARTALIERRGGNAFEDYLLPGMLIAFKQGFGRLLRSTEDRGAVLLFDRRIASKAYLNRLERCLPGFYPRDPQAERTWRGILDHLARVLPDVFPMSAIEGSQFDGILGPSVSAFQTLALPLHDPNTSNIALIKALAVFGFDGFRSDAQRDITFAQLQHRDVLGLMPTGSGKSLTFQLPALLGEGVTLVISPLIALMRDQVEHLQARGIEEAAALYSGQSADERTDALSRARAGQLKILYLSPERLRDPVLIETLRRCRVRALVVDEAHCLYAWGPHFRPEFLYITELFRHVGRVPVAALTATAPPGRRREIMAALGMDPEQTEIVVASFARPELRFVVYGSHSRFNRINGPQDKLRTLLKLLTAARRDGDAAVVYVNTTSGAEMLSGQLQLAGFDARAYHGRMDTRTRHDVQDLFMDDHIRIVVCTKAFGMGIDKPGIRYVIHYDVPGDLVAYAQEAGRAGRNLAEGEEAWCVLLYYPGDSWIHTRFAEDRLPDQIFLATVAADIAEQARGQHTVLYDVQSALERIGDEVEETAVNVALHRLAEIGYLERGIDVVTGALAARISGVNPDDNPDPLARQLLHRLPSERPIDVNGACDLLVLAAELALTPAELTTQLARLAMDGEIIFSPVRRIASLTLGEQLLLGEPPVIEAETIRRLRAEARTGWREMKTWAEQQSGCRTVELLSHLGEPGEPAACGNCDLCSPDRSRPWGDIADEDVPRPIDHVEATGLILEAIAWNVQRPQDWHEGALGEKTFWATLVANEYYLGKYARLDRLRTTPFFGLFRSFPGREIGLSRLFDRLIALGYATRSECIFAGRADEIRYSYPDLTERGWQALRDGEYVDLASASEA